MPNETPEFCLLGIDGAGKSTMLRRISECHPRVKLIHWSQFAHLFRAENVFDEALTPQDFILRTRRVTAIAVLRYLAALEVERAAVYRALGLLPIIDSGWVKVAAKLIVLGRARRSDFADLALQFSAQFIMVDTPVALAAKRKPEISALERPFGGSREQFLKELWLEIVALAGNGVIATLDGRQPVEQLAEDLLALVQGDVVTARWACLTRAVDNGSVPRR